MKANFIDIIILILYIVGMVIIAWYTRKKSKTVNDFLLAGSGMGGIMTAFAYGTTYFSAVIFIGYAGKIGYGFGLAAIWIGVGNAIIGSLFAWKLLAKRTRRMTHTLKAKTMPELFEARYDSKHIKLFTSLIVFIFLVPYASSVYEGLGYLFQLIFNVPFYMVVLVMATITAVYLFFGGYFATVLSDFFQGIVMLVGVVVMVIFVYNYQAVGGFINGIDKLINNGLGFFPQIFKGGQPAGYTLIMLVILTSVGSWGLPQIVHKFYTIKNNRAIKQATYVSTGFALIIGIGAYLVGCIARYYTSFDAGQLIASGNQDMIIPNVLVAALPAGLLGLIVVLVLSASMSTLASLTLASSSAVAIDMVHGYVKPNATDKQIHLLLRLLCLFFIAVSVVIALARPSSIINLMSISWGGLASCFLAPYFYGLYMSRATKKGVYATVITSLGLTVVLYIVSLIVPSSVASYMSPPCIGVYTMAISMAVMPIVSLLTAPPSKQVVERAMCTSEVEDDVVDDTIIDEEDLQASTL